MNPATPNARTARKSASMQNLLKLLLAAVILVLVNFLGFKHYTHQDLSVSQYYALSPKTLDVLAKLDGPLHIYSLLSEQQVGQNQQVEKLVEEYINAQKKFVSYEKIDPAFDPLRAKKLQDQLHFDAAEPVLIIQYKELTPRYVKIADFFEEGPMQGSVGRFKGEQQLTGTILALIEGKKSKVYFTEGHGESNMHDQTPDGTGFSTAALLLKDENIDATTVNLAQTGEVPADADAIIVAAPTIPFSSFEVTAIDHFLANNGKLLIMQAPSYTSGLEGLLAKYGIKFEDDLALHQYGTTTGGVITYPYVLVYQGGFSTTQAITAKFAQAGVQLTVAKARSITLPPATGPMPSKTQFLLQTDADAWGYVVGATPPENLSTLTYNKVTDFGGPLTIGAEFDAGMTTDPKSKATIPGTRIVALGFSSAFENGMINEVSANLFINSVDWLAKKDAVLDIAPKTPMEYGVSLSPLSFTTLAWTVGGVIPGAALLVGILIWFSRRK